MANPELAFHNRNPLKRSSGMDRAWSLTPYWIEFESFMDFSFDFARRYLNDRWRQVLSKCGTAPRQPFHLLILPHSLRHSMRQLRFLLPLRQNASNCCNGRAIIQVAFDFGAF